MLCREVRKSVDIQWSRGFFVLLHRDEKNDSLFHLCEGRLSFCRGMTKELLQFISFLPAEELLKTLPAVKREGWKAGAHCLLLMSDEQTERASNTLLRTQVSHSGQWLWEASCPRVRRKNSPWVSVIRHWLCSSSTPGAALRHGTVW